MSQSTPPSDTSDQPTPDAEHGSSVFAPVSVYFMDHRDDDTDAPSSAEMYSYTPTIMDLMQHYTLVGEDEAQSLSSVFQSWNDAPGVNDHHAEAWRSMSVGDIIVFNDTPYIIRPAGYDELSVTIPE
jgi:hypothetical protein